MEDGCATPEDKTHIVIHFISVIRLRELHVWPNLPHNLPIKFEGTKLDCGVVIGCVWRQVRSINFVAGVRTLDAPGPMIARPTCVQ